MKVAVVTSSVSRTAGGIFEIERCLAQSLHALPDTRLAVLGLRDAHTDGDAKSWAPLAPLAFPVLGPPSFGYAPALYRALERLAPDVVHQHGIWMYPSLAVSRWRERRGGAQVTTIHGMLDRWALRNSRWKKRLAGALYEHRAIGRASCLQVNTETEYESVRALGYNNPIAIVPNGVALPNDDVDVPPPPWSMTHGGKRVLLFLGRLHPKKGLPALLRAWAETRRRAGEDEWVLAIAGWAQDRHDAELRALRDELGLASTVLFLEPQYGIAKQSVLQHASAFVLPSFSEGLPMAVLEAWAHRVPVIMTAECNLTVGFDAGAAVRVSPDERSVAEGLRALFVMSDDERAAMGERGRRLVEERFSWDGVASELRAVFSWLLGGERPSCVHIA